ncbi:MAG: hypothetical protein JWN51_3509 [Phycisphaerales bacterium]|nr:hypothetical protein [Phycisphaerales bacterium]
MASKNTKRVVRSSKSLHTICQTGNVVGSINPDTRVQNMAKPLSAAQTNQSPGTKPMTSPAPPPKK